MASGKGVFSLNIFCRIHGLLCDMRNLGNKAVSLGVYRVLRKNRVAAALQFHSQLGPEAAHLRRLPPPFVGWCTLSSDADSPNMEGFLSTGQIIREQLALPISDSTFPHFLFNQGLVAGPDFVAGFPDFGRGDMFDFETFLERCGEWLSQVYRGRVDTVHGWLLRQQVRIGDDVVLGQPEAPKRTVPGRLRKTLGQIAVRGRRIHFRVPEGWHPKVPPRYLVFHYRAPTNTGMVRLVFVDGDEEVGEVNVTELPQGAPEALTPYIVDMQEIVGRDPDRLRRVDVEVRVRGRPERMEIRKPMMVSWLREDIEEQISLLEALNVRLSAYTSHGGGYNIGHYRVGQLDSADPRGMAELAQNPYFALDLFKAFGLRFFNTANNTSRRDAVTLADFVFPRTINNGDVVYDFNRFLHIPQDKAGCDDYGPFNLFGAQQNPSLANFAGWQVDALLHQIDEAGVDDLGGAVYTHLLSKCLDDPDRLDRSLDGLLSSDTRAALERLARRYYGHGGDVGKRVFVAPQALLLRYAQILSALPDAAAYDPDANAVHVRSWTDPVTKERIPHDLGGSDGLRYATFYVRNAATARLFVDGEEHGALVRNADDGSRGESVTVADAGSPTHLVGRVGLDHRPDRRARTQGCSWSVSDGNDHLLVVEADEARLTVDSTGVSLADHTALRVVLRGELEGVSWSLELETVDGCGWGISVGDAARDPGIVMAWPGPDERRHDVTVPFHRMTEAASIRSLPSDMLARFRLRVFGAQGRTVGIHGISLLRDDPRPRTDRCIIGGRVAPGRSVSRVVMGWDEHRFETPVLRGGWYVFLQRAPRGSVIRLHGLSPEGTKVIPDCGGMLEVSTDTLEAHFSLEAADSAPEPSL